MAKVEHVVLICDGCAKEDSDERPVVAHTVQIDGNPASRDACGPCWNKALGGLARVFGEAFSADRAPDEVVCLDCTPLRVFTTRHGLSMHRTRSHTAQLAATG